MALLRFLWLVVLTTLGCALHGQPRFAHPFTDGVVLQCEEPVSVWGFGAEEGQKLQVRFGGKVVQTEIVDESTGRWQIKLPALPPSEVAKKLELLVDGKVMTEVADVLVGEVWLAAGQSNMAFQFRQILPRYPEAKAWIDESDRPHVRLCRIPFKVMAGQEGSATAPAPTDLISPAVWESMNPETTTSFSAVAGVFAREMADRLDRPVGIVLVAMGGKPIEGFIPREAYEDGPDFLKEIVELADEGDLKALAKIEGGVVVRNLEGHPGAIFDAAMRPMAGFGLRGFLWYQAESNAGRGEDPRGYRHKMAALASGWRSTWKNDDLPLLYVQLPSYPPATGWIRVREEQRLSEKMIPHSAMAVTIDIPGDDIHPVRKIPVGQRLAQLAEVQVYRAKDAPDTFPQYAGYRLEEGKAIVTFTGIGAGLSAGLWKNNRLELIKDAAPSQFELADQEGKWHPAAARIVGKTVVLQHDTLREPTAVRYACAADPRHGPLLFSKDGLPVSPFCSELKLLPWEDQK